jgi:hypothetical protein
MKKRVFSVIVLLSSIAVYTGCIKNTPYVTTINPSMTASIGTYNFNAATVVPTTVDTQAHDSIVTLIITGNTSDLVYVNDKIIVTISKWKNKTGLFSMVMGEASGTYVHNGIPDGAIGGIVGVTKITDNSIVGYFSFNTGSGTAITNGEFTVGNPWNY